MKFKAIPVTSLEDATVNFEQLSTKDILNQTSESVLQLAVTGTARKVAYGAVNITFTASAQSAGTTVTHGLGTTPQAVFATCNLGPGNAGVIVYVSGATSTTFVVAGDRPAGAITGTIVVSWLAIG